MKERVLNLTESYKGKKILITGGLGFIGSNLAIKLKEYGSDITIIDSLVPEYGGNLFNINEIENQIKINISDVRDHHSLKYLILNQDYLFNLAGQTSHMDSMKDPFTDLEINAKSQLHILESCRKYNPDIKIVFASTRQIYGKPEYLPVDEKHILKPVDVNGINKMAGERYHILYNNVYGIRSCSLRLTNTYGPRMRIKDARQTFLGIWIRNLLERKPIEIWGGEQLRDFNYIDDVINAILMAGAVEKSNGKIYNLGSSEILSLKDTAKKMLFQYGSGDFIIKEFPTERKKIDIGDYYSDYSLIESDLNWEPEIMFEEGIRRTLDFFKENPNYYL